MFVFSQYPMQEVATMETRRQIGRVTDYMHNPTKELDQLCTRFDQLWLISCLVLAQLWCNVHRSAYSGQLDLGKITLGQGKLG